MFSWTQFVYLKGLCLKSNYNNPLFKNVHESLKFIFLMHFWYRIFFCLIQRFHLTLLKYSVMCHFIIIVSILISGLVEEVNHCSLKLEETLKRGEKAHNILTGEKVFVLTYCKLFVVFLALHLVLLDMDEYMAFLWRPNEITRVTLSHIHVLVCCVTS